MIYKNPVAVLTELSADRMLTDLAHGATLRLHREDGRLIATDKDIEFVVDGSGLLATRRCCLVARISGVVGEAYIRSHRGNWAFTCPMRLGSRYTKRGGTIMLLAPRVVASELIQEGT